MSAQQVSYQQQRRKTMPTHLRFVRVDIHRFDDAALRIQEL
jgi:hypothetical protein